MPIAISITQVIFVSVAGLLVVLLPMIWLQSRRAERVMKSMQSLLLEPSRAKLSDARALIEQALSGVVDRLTASFAAMKTVLAQHAARADALEKKLGVQNKMLVSTADVASGRIAAMTRTLENLVSNFSEVMGRDQWKSIQTSIDGFGGGVGAMVKELELKCEIITGFSASLSASMDKWSDSGRKLADELQQNFSGTTQNMNLLSVSVGGLGGELSALQQAVARDFENVRLSSHGMESVLANNDKLLSHQLENLENFANQAKKLLQSQVNALADTASRVGTEIRLSEASVEAGVASLGAESEKLFAASKDMKAAFEGIASEIMGVRARFQSEVGEFTETVVRNLREAESATAHTMEDSRQIAAVFADSLVPMLSRIDGTVAGLDAAKDRLLPLSDVMQRMETAMPKLAEDAGQMTAALAGRISEMADRIKVMNENAAAALSGIGNSTIKLEKLSGESRQQMIDLMGDYAKAAETMRELTASMAATRAAGPAAVMAAGAALKIVDAAGAAIPVQDFVKRADPVFERLHDLSVDLTRSIGAEIPDSVMDKYRNGDRAIFSKWFAKMIRSADKKRVRNMFRQDAVFRDQATQFVQGFAKMMTGAERTENKDLVVATLLKTDLGVMYQALKACLL
ncbi:MAG: hypothetical protein LBB08_02795 [Rickettsiales bacterium]|jgi:hypothetical protein|nr:hypothetical protein [Rickettsiales bacterium]